MARYVLRRLLLALPTLLIISLITFGLNKCSPYDPVISNYGDEFGFLQNEPVKYSAAYQLRAAWLGMDRPPFYFTLTTAALPDTLYHVSPPDRRERLRRLTLQTGSWEAVTRYENALWRSWQAAGRLPEPTPQSLALTVGLNRLISEDQVPTISRTWSDLDSLRSLAGSSPDFDAAISDLTTSVAVLDSMRPSLRLYQPVLYWHGVDNQYHRWLSRFIRGDLGNSMKFGAPVWQELRPALLATLLLNGLAILLAYLLAVPLGVLMARRRGRAFDRLGLWSLLVLYAMPVFWMGSLLILLFSSPHSWFRILPTVTIPSWMGSGKTLVAWAWGNAPQITLPIITLTLHILANLTLFMRGGMLEALGQDYVRTARAKGLDEDAVHWRHAFRNALFPLLTTFAGIFPAIFAGSLVVEYLFNYPGMGVKTRGAFYYGDIPVLLAIFMLSAVVTVLGSLLADLLYAWADPRVRFSQKS